MGHLELPQRAVSASLREENGGKGDQVLWVFLGGTNGYVSAAGRSILP
ncbi:MAG: hypothetical protein HW380_391 [Magnetococcales bacterium]|nr:hypothetical protein [Magnetococcales bacterium]